MTGPSASGSENGTPTSRTSAPARSSALRISPERGRSGSPAVVYVMRPVRPAARNRANVSSSRLTTASSCTTALLEDLKPHEDLEVVLYKTVLRGLRTLRAF